MCIIVDTNNLNRVFNPKNTERAEFIPVYQWIMLGNGKLVIGGSLFDEEIKLNSWFLPLLSQLSRIGKVVKIPNTEVDQLTELIQSEIREGEDFDDPHIVGLIAISKCKLICSSDKRAYPYFLKSEHYPKSHKPKIYTGIRNADLLTDHNICQKCKPSIKINKNTIAIVELIRDKIKK